MNFITVHHGGPHLENIESERDYRGPPRPENRKHHAKLSEKNLKYFDKSQNALKRPKFYEYGSISSIKGPKPLQK